MATNNEKKTLLKGIKVWILNKYTITIVFFLMWIGFIDNNSYLVIRELNKEIRQYEEQLAFYKGEFEKNDNFYKKLEKNKSEKEKFARENYFMKKRDEEIFIIVADTMSIENISDKK